MPILKAPPKPPKNETVQIRIEENTRSKLSRYAEFIDASESYVISEALRLLFRKDDEFRTWLEHHTSSIEPAETANSTPPKAATQAIKSGQLRSSNVAETTATVEKTATTTAPLQ